MSNSDFLDQATGALLGVAIGDAMGAPFDDMTAYDIYRKFGVPDGYFESLNYHRKAGDYTANTQLALLIASDVVKTGAKADRYSFAKAHSDALDRARGWDSDTKNAAELFKKNQKFEECGAASTTGWFLPKAIPLGIIAAVRGTNDDDLIKAAEAIVSFSHKGKAQTLAAAAIAMVVRECLRRRIGGGDKFPSPHQLYQSDESLFAKIVSMCRRYESSAPFEQTSIADRLDFARRKLQAGCSVKEFVADNGNSHDMYEAVSFSLFCFFNRYDDFSGIAIAASRGRAASLNACLVGGMVGAYAGTSFLANKKDMLDDLEGGQKIMILAEKLLQTRFKE